MVNENYKSLLFGFVAVMVIIIGLILFFSTGKAIISVVAKSEDVSTEFIIDVSADGGGMNMVNGMIYETEVEGTISGEATGIKSLDSGNIGKVTLINKRAENQVLIKTTRLQTQEGVLLRLTDRVEIPANGSIEASVYADNPSAFTELLPTSFVIPGLAENLQDKVYAESKSTIKPTGNTQKAIDQADITRVKEELTEILYEKAIDKVKQNQNNLDLVMLIVKKEELSSKADAEVGSIRDSFELGMKIKVAILGIEKQKLLSLAGENLKNSLNKGLDLQNISADKFTYNIQAYDPSAKTAKVKVYVEGQASVKADNQIFEKSKLAGLSPKGVELYLSNFEQIESVKVELSPFWIGTVPKSPDHVEIVVAQMK